MMVIVLNMDWFVFLKKKKTHFALNEPALDSASMPAGKCLFCPKARGCVGPGCNITGFGPRPVFLLCQVVIVNAA